MMKCLDTETLAANTVEFISDLSPIYVCMYICDILIRKNIYFRAELV